MVNMHLGLSPYYRGTGTNFWPLVNSEPECVGATLHLAVAKVDAGPVLAQVRPDTAADDRAHDLGTKTIIAGARRLPSVIRDLAAGRATLHTQDLSQGRLYRRRDFNAEAVRVLWRNLDAGMVADYVCDKPTRDSGYPIVV
jgi:methionyl-tRNA formyltransferase